MAAPNEQQWSQYEKVSVSQDELVLLQKLRARLQNYLLAEIIKLNNPSPSALLGVIAQFNMNFDWNNLILPPGQ